MDEFKACPMCGEQILEVAIKCKHCQSELAVDVQDVSQTSEEPAPEDESKSTTKNSLKGLGYIFCAIVGYSMFFGGDEAGQESSPEIGAASKVECTMPKSFIPGTCMTESGMSIYSDEVTKSNKLIRSGNYTYKTYSKGGQCRVSFTVDGTINGSSYRNSFDCEISERLAGS